MERTTLLQSPEFVPAALSDINKTVKERSGMTKMVAPHQRVE